MSKNNITTKPASETTAIVMFSLSEKIDAAMQWCTVSYGDGSIMYDILEEISTDAKRLLTIMVEKEQGGTS